MMATKLPKCAPEDWDQKQVALWRNIQAREFAEFHWLAHVPNGGKRDPLTAKAMREQGVVMGWPDWTWPLRRGKYVGIALELKRLDGGAGLAPEQLDALAYLETQGWYVCCAHGWQTAVRRLARYFSDTYIDFTPGKISTFNAAGAESPSRVGPLRAAERRAALADQYPLVPVNHPTLRATRTGIPW